MTDMFDVPADPEFFGPGYDKSLDQRRLSRHCAAVLAALRQEPRRWLTYERLAEETGVPAGSVRTRVSNLKAWGHDIETRTRADRFREVRLIREQSPPTGEVVCQRPTVSPTASASSAASKDPCPA